VRFRVPEPINASAGNIRTLNATGGIEAIKDQFGKAVRAVTTTFVFEINKMCLLEVDGPISSFLSFETIMSSYSRFTSYKQTTYFTSHSESVSII
jgi:hypothetical protein